MTWLNADVFLRALLPQTPKHTCLQVRFLSLTFTDFEVCEQEVEEGQ
jgi:hypothetical protein